MFKQAQIKTLSPSPFSVTMGEALSLATPKEIADYRKNFDIYGQSLEGIGTHHARVDDVKKLILAKLLNIAPNPNISIGESIDELIEMRVSLWRDLEEVDISQIDLPSNISANEIDRMIVGDLREALKDALKDLLDEAAYVAEGYARKRVYPYYMGDTDADLERLESAQRRLTNYGISSLSILDFDMAKNEELIKMIRQQKKSQKELESDENAYYYSLEEYLEGVEELELKAEHFFEAVDKVIEGSPEYKSLLQKAINSLGKAVSICDIALRYYKNLAVSNKLNSDFTIAAEQLVLKRSELLREIKTMEELVELYDIESVVASNFNWYKFSHR